ncbi:ABC transporter ATP-binding protein [Aetokthonos hydrillicola Thurmond2011]|jgi:lipopolysaccharide transport system ATP-binding protein|uniref:ABC transporter ATP-binding protein n=1 Tax=Aetokthonos hydrillicola Thurmond2011 TaxID=2712845 RepID=A0AAP5MAB2_9CYAN|nr:ABC transporter ATP-binding protein [Aetokthonos hydrillicola]MBO3460964.1 ABC transporter ATP-binding protein [Aetokthonos hydrillicola CCALA 1050]MBW4583637.1 ABC transporter ATP-binding protein [Aetokthonos hydrillicola CCALA 1050]MDR9895668.1 ABC transporter ATP-binding protein [Aetokthonos hydrillicola Thurmond2011]
MSDTAIKVENLAKKYVIAHHQENRNHYKTFAGTITNKAKSLGKALNLSATKESTPSREEFWALNDVSFEIKQGDRVGIIGRNGAGKSTLLKVLSRITQPTRGTIRTRGRVASLLEVGTGFHPELSGRENIFLNGAILGMSKAEIQRKFDEIVAFAEIEKFLDTPVKRYSSGMYVRLAFAVAAHLEPEILIVDEVLAVGDAQFQDKCLGKMKEVGKEGRTILFVSHNMSAIQLLCDRCLLMQKGYLQADGEPTSVVQMYLADESISNSFVRSKQKNGKPTLISGNIKNDDQSVASYIQIDVEIFSSEEKIVALELLLADAIGNPVGFGTLGALNPDQSIHLEPGSNPVSVILPINQLALGKYYISLDLTKPEIEYYDRAENCLAFEVIRPPQEGRVRVLSQSLGRGCLEIDLKSLKDVISPV